MKSTKCSETMHWLLSRQNSDGSFINLFSTITVLPSLIGALPYDVQYLTCPSQDTSGQSCIWNAHDSTRVRNQEPGRYIFISNHSCYTRLHGGTLLSEMDSVMKWSFDWFLIDQEPLKLRPNFTSITESWMVPLKSTSIGVLLFVILTDVPEVEKLVF